MNIFNRLNIVEKSAESLKDKYLLMIASSNSLSAFITMDAILSGIKVTTLFINMLIAGLSLYALFLKHIKNNKGEEAKNNENENS